MTRIRFTDSVRRLVPLAWPVLVGQIAVMMFSTIDTLMMGRVGPEDLAALAVGSAAYVTIFVGLMGVVLAIGPIAGRQFGADDLPNAGESFVQAQWLAVLLCVPGCLMLWFPDPFVWLAQLDPTQAAKVQAYTRPEAFALPAALLFTAFRGFSTAVSRPKAVMAMQLTGLAAKVPLNAVLVFGWGPIPAMGVAGCGWATAIAMIGQALVAMMLLRRDAFYLPFQIQHLWQTRPDWAQLAGLVRLGLPMGGSILVEVTGFTFMAFFIARLGATPVAGHQIAVNLVAMMFMISLALAMAALTLVAQHLGAGQKREARIVGRHAMVLGALVAATVGAVVALAREPIVALYTSNPEAAAAALPLLVWVWFFHLGDALQTVAAHVLRAYQIATLPMVIYVIALWGFGLGGGYFLAFGANGNGALGFWQSATAGLIAAAVLLSLLLKRVFDENR
ncbi:MULTISPECIES: MATE family efflux transporter [unclassified Roseateles]|uniref:MATE family efflux transporter n=1 Tax=unclassified Roseateles TaxID=2626991 RepID=UPI0006F65E1D|nr:MULTISPECIES: MATE family efflux transporter [unclassified Roseateles]KQW41214.1 MATE family efflux transporter [Pelomonas sp. Root405]KRA67986.1 MATE family efflux transporter [Pelomonas sp. Root662]